MAHVEGREVLVSYSGGKDSMILLDLAARFSKRFEAFFMETVQLEHVDKQIAWAEKRYGITVRRYPHWILQKYRRDGVFCFHSNDTREIDISQIYTVARADAGIDVILHGAKRTDSMWRRRTGAIKFAADNLKAPLWNWNKIEVISYLKTRSLPVPDMYGSATVSGVELSTNFVKCMHEKYFEDYKRLERSFPFVGAIIEREKLIGSVQD